MRDFRDKTRTPRFNRNAPRPRRDSPTSPAKPTAAPPPARDYRRVDADAREPRRASGNDREIVYVVEPIRALKAASHTGPVKERGYCPAARAPGGDTAIDPHERSRKLAIIVGFEGRGFRDIVKKGAHFVVDIPMRGKVGSLNVSVPAAVALFEI